MWEENPLATSGQAPFRASSASRPPLIAMSTSVASSKHMEAWRRERAEEKQTIVPTNEKQKASFR